MIKISNEKVADFLMLKLGKLDNNFKKEELETVKSLFLNSKDSNGNDEEIDLTILKYFTNLEELELRIMALLRRAKINLNHKINIGDFTMDDDEHTAYLNNEEISLTTREFNILYKLLSYPKKTFTRSQLMNEFWDSDTLSSSRTVDVYMTKLRAKLANCNDFEIVTVHGLGYKAVLNEK